MVNKTQRLELSQRYSKPDLDIEITFGFLKEGIKYGFAMNNGAETIKKRNEEIARLKFELKGLKEQIRVLNNTVNAQEAELNALKEGKVDGSLKQML